MKIKKTYRQFMLLLFLEAVIMFFVMGCLVYTAMSHLDALREEIEVLKDERDSMKKEFHRSFDDLSGEIDYKVNEMSDYILSNIDDNY